MNDARFDRIADGVLDGTAGEEDRRELERRLERDPAARVRFENLRSTFEMLSRVPRPEPPADLRDSILAAVRSQPSPDASWGLAWRSLLRRGPTVRFAYAGAGFMAGTLLALIFTGALLHDPRDFGPVSGTMSRPEVSGATIRDGSLILPGVRLTVETVRLGDRLELKLKGLAERAAKITVASQPGELRVVGMARPGTDGTIGLDEGRLVLAGRGTLSLQLQWTVLTRKTSPLLIELAAEGERKTLELDVTPEPRGSPAQN